jgi:hypothetical protein
MVDEAEMRKYMGVLAESLAEAINGVTASMKAERYELDISVYPIRHSMSGAVERYAVVVSRRTAVSSEREPRGI